VLRLACSLELTQAAVVFVVNRGDCHSVSVRRSSCPALAVAAPRAAAGGVAFHAFRVRWAGSQAHFDGMVPTDV
jgi:DNA-binding sugar fermentation-stimulating protein